jgi:hypothetical protein
MKIKMTLDREGRLLDTEGHVMGQMKGMNSTPEIHMAPGLSRVLGKPDFARPPNPDAPMGAAVGQGVQMPTLPSAPPPEEVVRLRKPGDLPIILGGEGEDGVARVGTIPVLQ